MSLLLIRGRAVCPSGFGLSDYNVQGSDPSTTEDRNDSTAHWPKIWTSVQIVGLVFGSLPYTIEASNVIANLALFPYDPAASAAGAQINNEDDGPSELLSPDCQCECQDKQLSTKTSKGKGQSAVQQPKLGPKGDYSTRRQWFKIGKIMIIRTLNPFFNHQ